mmetsp:Transcript_24979/g.80706  ORF Transcript_24979/g.80706 Transcript_24979/m.80706 type:complete len:165 (-) Transcript_24979:48-542(-)
MRARGLAGAPPDGPAPPTAARHASVDGQSSPSAPRRRAAPRTFSSPVRRRRLARRARQRRLGQPVAGARARHARRDDATVYDTTCTFAPRGDPGRRERFRAPRQLRRVRRAIVRRRPARGGRPAAPTRCAHVLHLVTDRRPTARQARPDSAAASPANTPAFLAS